MTTRTSKIIKNLINDLAKYANEIIHDEMNNVTYTNRSYNLHDSYGWGVYLNGRLKASGYSTPMATESKTWYGEQVRGSEAIRNFIERVYKAHNGIDVVVAVAMPYGLVLQTGHGYGNKVWEVIAIAQDKLKMLSQKYKGSTYGIIINR